MSEPLSTAQVFQLEEYKALRKEVEFYIAEFRSQERNVVIAVGVIWAWLISNHQSGYLPWFLPVLLCAAASIRSHVLNKHMRRISTYIESLEDSFGVNGWEHTFTIRVVNVKRSDFANTILTYTLLALSVVALFFHSGLVEKQASPVCSPASTWRQVSLP
jgi:hypothetical protein